MKSFYNIFFIIVFLFQFCLIFAEELKVSNTKDPKTKDPKTKDPKTELDSKDKDKSENSGEIKSKKKRFDWMGIPFMKFRTDFGVGAGAKVSIFDYGTSEEELPFRYNLQLQYFLTHLGQQDHVLYFMAPKFMKSKINMDLELRYQYLDNSRYYGIGNDAKYNQNYIVEGKSAYINNRYYDYKRTKPRFIVNYLYTVYPNLNFLLGLGVQKTTIRFHNDSALLLKEAPYGINGGYTNFLKLGLVYDTRDFIASPSKGMWTELHFETANSALVSDYSYERYTITDRRYITLIKDLVWAQQIVYEWMTGDPPFYEYSFIGGSATLTEGLGGNQTLRGYLQNRFIDNTKLYTNTEFRYLLWTKNYKNERFDFFPIGFWDMGRVYKKPSDFSLTHIRYSYGGGLRIAWNRYFVGRFDYGLCKEGVNISIGFSNIF